MRAIVIILCFLTTGCNKEGVHKSSEPKPITLVLRGAVITVETGPRWDGVVLVQGNKLGFFESTFSPETQEHSITTNKTVVFVQGVKNRFRTHFTVPDIYSSVIKEITFDRWGNLTGLGNLKTCSFKVQAKKIPWKPKIPDYEGVMYFLEMETSREEFIRKNCSTEALR